MLVFEWMAQITKPTTALQQVACLGMILLSLTLGYPLPSFALEEVYVGLGAGRSDLSLSHLVTSYTAFLEISPILPDLGVRLDATYATWPLFILSDPPITSDHRRQHFQVGLSIRPVIRIQIGKCFPYWGMGLTGYAHRDLWRQRPGGSRSQMRWNESGIGCHSFLGVRFPLSKWGFEGFVEGRSVVPFSGEGTYWGVYGGLSLSVYRRDGQHTGGRSY